MFPFKNDSIKVQERHIYATFKDNRERFDLTLKLEQSIFLFFAHQWCKTKKDSLDNIKRYKARLVVKGFTQKEGIDYKETFSHVYKKNSFHIIMALVVHFDLKL